MQIKRLFLCLIVLFVAPIFLFAHPDVTLLDENGNPIINTLKNDDNITAANGSVYYRGNPFSPKKTCGKCHDYNAITQAYHFRTGTGPKGEDLSDTWSAEHRNDPLYKYLANAYGYLLSPGQFGAW